MDIIRRARLGEIDRTALEFMQSIKADQWIFKADLAVDRAHTRMLLENEIISEKDASLILDGLDRIEEAGIDALNLEQYEDIHASVESRLIELVGEDAGGRMHTARSRNDEVATCIRIALREELEILIGKLKTLQRTILMRAEEHLETVMPGFTHLQFAQPTTLAHHLLAHFDSLCRDLERLDGLYSRTNRSPLGAAAFASTSFPIDRMRTMELLGFEGLIENSMDAVSARDFLIEAISVSAIIMMHLSRLSEELILWSSQGFDMIELDDTVTSTSSIMPQKKNPDLAELIRAKTGTVNGALTAALTIMKAMPMSYNRDLQELTPHLIQAVTITAASVSGMERMIGSMKVNSDSMRSKLELGDLMATDLADALVRERGLPFRTAHRIVGKAVSEGYAIEELDEATLREVFDPMLSVNKRNVIGGPAPAEVKRMIDQRRRELALI